MAVEVLVHKAGHGADAPCDWLSRDDSEIEWFDIGVIPKAG
jgi:hypothetical protein